MQPVKQFSRKPISLTLMRSLTIISLFTSLIISGCSEPSHEIEQKHIAALQRHLTPIRSINPHDTDFTDLLPLTDILKEKQIVLLGEQSHGDGATFLAKARLVKFLHQRMGFDVFAIESGFFDCEFAGTLIEQRHPVQEAVRSSTFDVWTASREFLPVTEYIQETQQTERPLRFTGFDLQVTGPYGRDSSLHLLRRYLYQYRVHTSADSFVLQLLDTLVQRPKRFAAVPDSLRTHFYNAAEQLVQRIETSSAPEHAMWGQELRSKITLARIAWNIDWNKPDPAVLNLRDEQMAKNLLWLSRIRYPGKKIIVWAASSHISRNRQEILHRSHSDTDWVPMGHHLWSAMGDSIFALGFTAFEGTMGLRYRNGTVLAAARPGTLEDILYHTDHQYSFLNFQTLADDHWLQDTVRARPFGYSTMLARWPQMLDGILYIQTMTPSHGVEQE